MKKNIIALFISLCVFACSATAFAGTSGFYVAPRTAMIFMGKGDSSFGETNSQGEPSTFGNGSGLSLGASIGIAGGYDFQYSQTYLPVRVEGEVIFRTQTTEVASFSTGTGSGDKYEYDQGIGVSTFMAHAYYDFYNSSVFTPYVSFGAGLARVTSELKVENIIYEDVDNNLALAVGVGASWQTQFGFNVDLGYRFTYVSKVDVTYGNNNRFSKASPSMSEITLGIRYVF